MPSLALFSPVSTTPQTAVLAFGVESPNKFRVTSLFAVTANTKAYAMIKGTVLLQQQASNVNKVNLILKPQDQKEFKLPVKYIIYRGLQITDFIVNNNLTDPNNKVKTSGSELLAAMQLIQQGRAPGDDIPLEALFGNELSPANTKNIDEFFFKNEAPSSQLFTVECGVELGNFMAGQIGIEIILENPELFINVELAKKDKYEIDVSGVTDTAQKKWQKDLVRHFVDPAAYYGLHYDIKDGIEYRDNGGNKQVANTATLVYNNILAPFANTTRNTVYLDIRNENGYSYNYYNNYIGASGPDADKELKIGQTSGGITAKEYYTDGWAIHKVDITPGTGTENEFFIALRISDNPRPLLASWNIVPTTYQVADPPVANPSNSRVYYTDETALITTTPAEFTTPIGFKVSNIATISKQVATIVKLNYIKQSIPLTSSVTFPRAKFTDYLFGPLEITIPWDTDNKIQWFTSNHKTYVDALNDGYVLGKYKTTILNIDLATKEIEISAEVPVYIFEKVIIENDNGSTINEGKYTPMSISYANGKTKIKVLETIPSVVQNGDKLSLAVKMDGEMDYINNQFLVNNNRTSLEVLSTGNTLNFYSHFNFSNSFEISSSFYNSANNKTQIIFTDQRPKAGFAGFIETGHIIDIDTTTTDNDRIIFYASVLKFFTDNGLTNLTTFNAKGGILNFDSILNLIPDVIINRINLKVSSSENILSLSYSSKDKSKAALFMLGITKIEFEGVKNSANAVLSPNHIKLFKLISQGESKTDLNKVSYYKYELIIAGLTSAGIYQEVNTGIDIYTTDHLIFSSKEFAAKYELDFTQAEINLTQFINETLGVNGGSGDGVVHDKLQVSNEEKINLEKGKFWTIYGEGEPNKNLFNLDPTMKDKVILFKSTLDSVQDDFTVIETLIRTKGAELLQYAKQRIKIQNQPYTNKDGILYLTRLIMQVILKNHPKLLSKFPSKIEDLSDQFEKHSRGLEGTEKPVFTQQTSSNFNILISGYDPFTAIYGFNGYKYYDWGDHQSNSSGNLALALDGVSTNPINGKIATIKSVIFPVRYREFDKGWIEDFFKSYVNDNNIKMIITFSYGVDGDIYSFEIERFASRKRGGSNDNNLMSTTSNFLNIPDKDNYEFINTKLPFDDMYIADDVGLDQMFTFQYFNNSVAGAKRTINNPSEDLKITPLIPEPELSNYPPTSGTATKIKSISGSGGSYLSNEIFYRVAWLRENSPNPEKFTGHIHVGFLSVDAKTDRTEMFNIIKESLRQAIENFTL